MRSVVYFTAVPLENESNGGNICCRNHIRRLKEDENINLFVVAAVSADREAATAVYLAELGVEHSIVTIADQNVYQEELSFWGAVKFGYRTATNYPWELRAMNQRHIETAVMSAIQHRQAEWIVIDYLFSALFCESIFKSSVKVAIITLNQEAVFHKQMIDLGIIRHDNITAQLSYYRLKHKETSLYKASDKVIAIGSNDIPAYLDPEKALCITPYLDLKPQPWSFSPETASDVFFVGNHGHYPNRLAIEFIATSLAPAVGQRRPDIRFKIVGATAADVPAEWRHHQIDYLGFGDAQLVDKLFRQSGMFICPVLNEFGMKFKVAEAVSYGTPTCVSIQTKKGIPYAPSVPPIDLNAPEPAADLICSTAGNETALIALNHTLCQERDAFMADQIGIWSRTLS